MEDPLGTWEDSKMPTFQWVAVTGADKYEFKILNSSGGTVYPVTTITPGSAHTYTITTNLTDQSDYTWMLRAHVSAGNIWTDWASAPFSVYTFVSVNLALDSNGNVDDEKGLGRPDDEPCDGKTIADGTWTPKMRKNKGIINVPADECNMDPDKPNTACTQNKPCQYIYFDVEEEFMSSINTHPNVDIVVTYFDHKPVTDWATHFCIKYKNASGPTSKCITSPVGNTDTMKTFTFVLNDAFFGNTLVGNDFRIECRTDANGNPSGNKDTRRWIDTVKVIKK